jgi:acyl-CoA thioester hydrolase
MGAFHTTLQKLRFCDTDRLGHINNAVYAVMYEAGRAEMLEQAGLLAPEAGRAVVIARLEIDFLREMNWPGEVSVESAIHRIGTKSFTMRQRLMIDGVLCSRALSVLAVIDTGTRRAVPLETAWKADFETWLDPEFT